MGSLIGPVIELDFPEHKTIVCTNYPRVKVEILTSRPLTSGCSLPRKNMAPAIVAFRYERLSNFCTLCGRFSHLKNGCPVPPALCPPEGTFTSNLRSEIAGVHCYSRALLQGADSGRRPQWSGESSFSSAISERGSDGAAPFLGLPPGISSHL